MTPMACLKEEQRIAALRTLDILDTPPEETFDRLARIAAGLFQAPVARVSLVDDDREFLKAAVGCELGSFPRKTAFCSWTVTQDRPLIVTDLAEDPRFAANPRVDGPPHYRFYAGAPLTDRDGHNLGAICCLDMRPRHPTSAQILLLQDLAQVVVETMDLRRVATTDSLTGALRRWAFMDALRRDLRLAARSRRSLACLLLDVDHFKAVNDSHGHAAGDEVLRRLSALCRGSLRDSDYCGRLGGEEFSIILLDTDLTEAFAAAERLREKIAAETFSADGRTWRVTASFGVSGSGKDSTSEGLVGAADAALYKAKRIGRNRTMISGSEVPARLRPKLVANG